MQDNLARVKVCFVITKGYWGGATKYVFTLATSLPKDQFEVVVICGEGNDLKNKLKEKGIICLDLPNLKRDISLYSEIKNFFALVKILKKERPDVLHLYSSKAGGLGSLAGRIARIPKIIFTAHGWAFNEERKIVEIGIIALASWITVVLSHKTIVIAERERKQAISMPFVNEKKIVLIRNGISKIDFKEKSI